MKCNTAPFLLAWNTDVGGVMFLLEMFIPGDSLPIVASRAEPHHIHLPVILLGTCPPERLCNCPVNQVNQEDT